MKYTDVVKFMKQAAMEVTNPKELKPSKSAAKPDPSKVGYVKYKDPKTGKWIEEHPVRDVERQSPAKRAPIKKPAAPTSTAPTTSIPMTFSTGPAANMPYKRIQTRPFGNPISRRPRVISR